MLHILCNSTSNNISEHFKLFAQSLQKLGGKKCLKLATNVSLLSNLLKNCSLEECQQSKNASLVTFAKVRKSKSQKNRQKITKTGYTNTFALGNPSKHRQIKFSVD